MNEQGRSGLEQVCEECWHMICRCPLPAKCPRCETEYVTSWAEWADCPVCRHPCNPLLLPDDDKRYEQQLRILV